jgi:3-oxoadipate enol-lactonase
VRVEDHSADAAALLRGLGISRAHVAGHSSGGAVALQLALDHPDLVHTLILLEPSLLSVPSALVLLERALPAFEAYHAGDHAAAVVGFLSVVSGLDSQTCRAVLEEQVPGGIAQAIEDAETFFELELPALGAWRFGAPEAARISQPSLSVRGAETDRLWVDVAALLRDWLPDVTDLVVPGVGHLLHLQRPGPVMREVTRFLSRHTMQAGRRVAPLSV